MLKFDMLIILEVIHTSLAPRPLAPRPLAHRPLAPRPLAPCPLCLIILDYGDRSV